MWRELCVAGQEGFHAMTRNRQVAEAAGAPGGDCKGRGKELTEGKTSRFCNQPAHSNVMLAHNACGAAWGKGGNRMVKVQGEETHGEHTREGKDAHHIPRVV